MFRGAKDVLPVVRLPFVMIRIFLILLQAPGIIAHELSHALLCVLSGVKIFRMKLLRFSDPPGFVEHAEPEEFLSHVLIACGPFIGNSLLALVLAGRVTWGAWNVSTLVYGWLAFVIGLHAIPSDGDLDVLLSTWWSRVKHEWLLIAFLPLFPILYAIKLIKRLRGRTIYAAALLILGAWYLKIR